MKTKNLLMMAAVATVVLAACTSNDEVEGVDVSNTPMTFITNVNQASTRAGHAAGTLTAGSFGLFVTTTDATDDTRYNTSNRQMTYTDVAWTAPTDATQLLWKDNSTSVSYMAYMPYNAEAVEGTTIKTAYPLNTSANQTETTIDAEDFLYVTGTTTGSASGTSGIALAFSHKLSQFKITLAKGSEVVDENITFTSVKLTGCCGLATTINLTNGTVATTPTDAQTSTVTLLENSQSEYECILVPQTFTLKVTVTGSNNKEYVYTSNATSTFESGKTYTLPLTVGRDKVTMGVITATSWGNGVTGDGDKLGTE